jgi:hypothetical protein
MDLKPESSMGQAGVRRASSHEQQNVPLRPKEQEEEIKSMRRHIRTWAMILTVLGSLSFAAASNSAVLVYQATIDGSQETPPTNSPAVGYGEFTIDTDANSIHYAVTFNPDSLLAPETAAHIHCCAPPGTAAPVMIPLPLGSPKIGDGTYDEANEGSILAGLSYVNIHTEQYPGGEIRGQIVPVPIPAEKHTWGKIKAHYR